MKSILVALLTLTASFASADYFACTIKIGKESQTFEAEYHETKAKVEFKDYKCYGELNGSMATTTIFSPEEILGNNSTQATGIGFSEASLNDGASCICGLQ
ncbi:MAG: hypothetical protein V4736_09455 [Bdellovibrionota bacterium]